MTPLHLRPNLYDVPVSARKTRPVSELLSLASPPPGTALPGRRRPALAPKGKGQRARIWELNSNLHCSIIGTCLSAAELRRLLICLNVAGIETADEHEVHMLGVLMAGRPKEGAKFLQKALDRRHHGALNQFAKAKDDVAIAALWEKAAASGDIPGAYWAVLTHADLSDKLVQRAFSDVHMLSHLMGATNCADLRRMRQLEEEVASLSAKIERQQKHLRDGFLERDCRIEQLNALLSDRAQSEFVVHGDGTEAATLKVTIDALQTSLAHEISQRERLEQRQQAFDETQAALRRIEDERSALRNELRIVETQLQALLPSVEADPSTIALAGSTILYVGGRPHQVPQLKALVEHADGVFVHHDGGVEHAPGLLVGLVSRADMTVFPVDCISHNAVTAVKRTCRQFGRPYVALRTSSLTCLLAALATKSKTALLTDPVGP